MDKQRSLKTNNALHLFFKHLADELNAAGLDMRTFLKPSYRISWSEHSVKEHIWRSVQQHLYGKKSTAELTQDEVRAVYEEINRIMGENWGIHVPFPSEEEQRIQSLTQ